MMYFGDRLDGLCGLQVTVNLTYFDVDGWLDLFFYTLAGHRFVPFHIFELHRKYSIPSLLSQF